MVAAVRALVADLQGDMAGVQRLAEQARANLAERNPLRGEVAFTLGDVAYQLGDLEGAEREWGELRRLGQVLGAPGMVASAARSLMAVEETRGRLRAALALGHEALTIARAHPELQCQMANVNIYLSHILYEQNDLQGAEHALQEAIRHGETGGTFDTAVAIQTMLARVRIAQGDLTGAAEALSEAERGIAARPVTSDLAAECAAARVRLWLAQSCLPDGAVALLPAAERWADEWQARPGDRLVWAEELKQIEVLRLAADGLSNREIAARLIVTIGTVKTHLHNVYGKLGV